MKHDLDTPFGDFGVPVHKMLVRGGWSALPWSQQLRVTCVQHACEHVPWPKITYYLRPISVQNFERRRWDWVELAVVSGLSGIT